MTKITDWANCYDDQWKGLLWEDKESGESAFSHPAKMSRGLVFRIIEYALQNGLIQPGQTVVDCFGGVGTTALPCLMNGLNYIGVELESRFVTFGRKNIDLWNGKFSSMPKWVGSAVLLQGDSRHLAEVIAGAGLVVSSPPYAETPIAGFNSGVKASGGLGKQYKLGNNPGGSKQVGDIGYGSTNGNLGNLPPGSLSAVISSPPFAGNTGGRGEASRNGINAALFDRHSGGMKKGTGSDPANLDHLPMGTVGAVIGSPPYADGGVAHNNQDYAPGKIEQAKANGVTATRATWGHNKGSKGQADYGSTNGQLGAMVVGSPPYEGILQRDRSKEGYAQKENNGQHFGTAGSNNQSKGYNPDNPANIGNESGETFWTAARLIVDQCYQILPDGAAAIWVLKAYIKGGKVVDFPGQWQALCEACGFETVEIIRAWLVKRNGAQATIEGGTVSKDVARKSFFRRLSESNTKAAKHWQTLSRNDQARLLWSNHGDLWRDYFVRLALFNLPDEDKQKAGVKLDMTAPPIPNYKRVLKSAQSEAYARDGKPDYEIETSIDFETVLVTRKKGVPQ